ncbi:MAG: hypothetical protein AAF558_14345 [Verrucomicrobiota bacterium]
MKRIYFPLPVLISLPWAIWLARGLPASWQNAPFDQHSEWVFAFWLTGCFWMIWERPHFDSITWSVALAAQCLGVVGQLNILIYLGLALMLMSLTGIQIYIRVIWIGTALFWMPVIGWLFKTMGADTVVWIRFAGLLVAVFILTAWQWTQQTERTHAIS